MESRNRRQETAGAREIVGEGAQESDGANATFESKGESVTSSLPKDASATSADGGSRIDRPLKAPTLSATAQSLDFPATDRQHCRVRGERPRVRAKD